MPEIRSSTPIDYSMPPESPGQPDDSDEPEEDPKITKRRSIRNIISTVALFLAAPLMALILILFVIQSYEVDGPSMNYTLHDKDLLIVSKIPRTLARITHHDYIPPRYQVIIFTLDEGGTSRQLVKRVIGLPGERVVVKGGEVTIFNKQNSDGFKPDENQEYTKYTIPTSGNVDVVVPEDYVFAMGDNRGNSLDSRAFGPISADTIVGKLGIRIFPLSSARKF